MKYINCPMNGPRPENEFAYGGRIRAMPKQSDADAVWTDYLFMDDNSDGEVWEWWCHTPSVYWFAARRHLSADEWLETVTVAEAKKRLDF